VSPLFRKGLAVGVIITIISFAVFTFEPVGKERLAEKEVGKWIKQYHQGKKPLFVVSDSNRIPYYAGAKIAWHYEGSRLRRFGTNYAELIKNLHTLGYFKADYLVVDKNNVNSFIPDFTSRLNPAELEQIYPPPADNTDRNQILFVYRVK
jgi:hypothetical protein